MKRLQKIKEEKAITLVALVITIIILLILATISIQGLTHTGIFERTNKAKLETKRSQITEWLSMNLMEAQTNNYNKKDEKILEVARKNAEKSQELKKLGKDIDVDGELSTEKNGGKVPPYFNVIVDNDMYKVSMDEQGFIGEVGKIIPYVDFQVTATTKSINIKVSTKRYTAGRIEYYIRSSDESSYGEATKVTNDKEYIFDNLEQSKKYRIKVVVISENGQKAECEKEVETVEVPTSNVAFEVEPKEDTNQNVVVKVIPGEVEQGYKVQTSIDGQNWTENMTVTFIENGNLYVRIFDGKNYSSIPQVYAITNIDKKKPEIEETVTTPSTIKIKAVDLKDENSEYSRTSGIIGYALTTTNSKPANFIDIEKTSRLEKTITGLNPQTQYYIWVKDKAGNISDSKAVMTEKEGNSPEIMTGMSPIKFTDPIDTQEGTTIKTTTADSNWYNYTTKKWANAQTQDGSMWVWIPRYAYKIIYNDQNDKSKGGKIDIVFLIGTTDNYYDKNGNIQTAQRQKSEEQIIETDASKTDKYTVHPAFTNENSINYANGGWDKELTGIWVSKFEAGYAGGNNTATVKDSSVSYSEVVSNYYGTNTEKVKIKYPTFQGLTYSMNLISTSDAFDISKALVENGNIYGLNSSTDSHLIKNSEWGAVAYLGQSKYGLDEVEICMNNANLNDTTKSVYAITGCSGKSSKENQILTTVEKINSRTQEDIYVWTQKNGTKASSTGTIYGVYDMAGGAWERTTGLINNGDANLMQLRKIINEYTSKWKKFKICNCISI